MPETQEHKVAPIIKAVQPTLPENVPPPQLQPGSTSIFMSIGGAKDMPQLGQTTPIDEDIVMGAIPEDNHVEGAIPENLHVEGAVPEKGYLSRKAMELCRTVMIPNKYFRDLTLKGIKELYDLTPYREPEFNKQWANFIYSLPKETIEALALTGVDLTTDPINLALMGYGKGVSALMKSPVGKEFLTPLFKSTLDYYAARTPEFLRVDKSPVIKYLTEPIGTGKVAKGLGVIGEKITSGVQTGLEKIINVIPEKVKEYTSYKYGLAGVEEFMHKVKTLRRINAENDEIAYKTGMTLWHGLSKEGQKIATEILESKEWDYDAFERMSLLGKHELSELKVKDPKKLLRDLSDAKRLINDNALKLVQVGLETKQINDDLADIILNNKDKYLHRVYTMFDNPEISRKILSGEETLVTSLGLVEDIEVRLAKIGFTEDMIAAFNSLPEAEKVKKASEIGIKYVKKFGPRGISVLSNALKKRKLENALEQQLLGPKGPGYRTALTIREQRRLVNNWRLLKDLSEDENYVSKKPREFFQKVYGPKWGPLNGKYVNRECINELEGFVGVHSKGDIYSDMWKLWEGTSRMFKVVHVTLSPATRQINKFGNSIMHFFGGMNLEEQHKYLKLAEKAKKTNNSSYKLAVSKNLFTTSFAQEELLKKLKSPIESIGKDIKIHQKIYNKIRKLSRAYSQGFQNDEERYKLMRFLWEMEKHGNADIAAKEAQKWGFDYAHVNPVVRFLRTNPIYNIPFFTFVSKAVPRIVETAIMDPIRLKSVAVLIGNMNVAALRSIGPTETDMDYLKSKKGYFLIVPGTRTKTGKPFTVNLNNLLPFSDIATILGLGAESLISSPFAAGGPGVLALEATTGKTLGAYKRDLYTNFDTRSVKIKKGMAHIYQGMLPSLTPGPDPIIKMGLTPIEWMLEQSDMEMPEIAKKATFGSDAVRIGGGKILPITDAGYQLISEAFGKDSKIAKAWEETFTSYVNKEMDSESALFASLASAIFGLNAQPLDENMLKYYDLSQLQRFETGGDKYNALVKELLKEKLTPEIRGKIIQIWKNNLIETRDQIIDAKNRMNLGDKSMRIIGPNPESDEKNISPPTP